MYVIIRTAFLRNIIYHTQLHPFAVDTSNNHKRLHYLCVFSMNRISMCLAHKEINSDLRKTYLPPGRQGAIIHKVICPPKEQK